MRDQARNGDELALIQLDLASLDSVRACADTLVADGRSFDLIIANAGVMACPKGVTADGFETHFGTNHLGHFVLVNRLASLLKPGSRVGRAYPRRAHRFSDVDLDDPNFEHTPYTEFIAYGRSKTANVLFAVGFDRRHKDRGVRATAVHPGVIRTELGRHMTPELTADYGRDRSPSAPAKPAQDEEHRRKAPPPRSGAGSSRRRTPWAGAIARTATSPDIAPNDASVHGGVLAYALNPTRAEALWTKSEEMVGERF